MAVNLILELGFTVQYYSLILRRNCFENYKCEICENLAIFFLLKQKKFFVDLFCSEQSKEPKA